MKNDRLKQFVSLRAELVREKNELVGRLAEIDNALGAVAAVAASANVVAPKRRGRPAGRPPGRPAAAPAPAPASTAAPAVAKAKAKGKSKAPRAKNALSLRDVVLAVTKAGPLPRKDILKAVRKQGYVFAAKDPLNSLSTLLYTNKSIKNYGGKFGPA